MAQTRGSIGAGGRGAGGPSTKQERAKSGRGESCLGGSGVSKLLSVPLWALSSLATPNARATPPLVVQEVAVKWGWDSVLVACAALEQGVVGGGSAGDLGAIHSQKSSEIGFM